MVRRLVLVSSLVVCSLAACKKDKPDAGAQQGTGAAGQQGSSGQANTPTTPAPEKKAPEGCNSDLSQRIEVDFTFTEKCSPYTVSGDLNVEHWNLTIEPGVEVRFKESGALYVGYSAKGRLLVKGTPEKPVKFTAASSKEAGAWKTIQLYENAEGSVIENAVIEFAGTSDTAALRVEAGDVTLKGVAFVSVKATALTVDAEKPAKELSGLDLSKAGGDPDALVTLRLTSANALGAGNVFPDKAIITLSGNVNRDVKLSPQGPAYRITGEVSVEAPEGKSALFTVQAGVTVQLGESAAIYVGYSNPGALKVQGTKEKPVVFTRYGEDPKASPWKGLFFYGSARAPEIDFAVFEYAGRPNEEAIKFVDPRGLGKFTNSVIRHCAGTAIKVENPKARFEAFDGNVFEDVTGPALDMPLSFAHALGRGNTFGSSAVVLRDATHEDTTLSAIEAPYWLQGDVSVEGATGKTATLTLEPGVKVRALENAALFIGYSGGAKLVAKGTAEKGVTFEVVQGTWKGVHVYGNGAVELENVTISGVADDVNPLVLDADSGGSIKALTLKGKKGLKSCGKATVAGVKADKGVKAEEKCE